MSAIISDMKKCLVLFGIIAFSASLLFAFEYKDKTSGVVIQIPDKYSYIDDVDTGKDYSIYFIDLSTHNCIMFYVADVYPVAKSLFPGYSRSFFDQEYFTRDNWAKMLEIKESKLIEAIIKGKKYYSYYVEYDDGHYSSAYSHMENGYILKIGAIRIDNDWSDLKKVLESADYSSCKTI